MNDKNFLILLILYLVATVINCSSPANSIVPPQDKSNTNLTKDEQTQNNGKDQISVYRGGEARSLVIDDNGNIYIAGWEVSNIPFDCGIWKYGPDGEPDRSFGTDGIVNISGDKIPNFHNGDCQLFDIAIDNNNDLLVTGRKYNNWNGKGGTDNDLIILKLNLDGQLISSFGSGGIVTYHAEDTKVPGMGNDYGYSIAVDNANNIFVSGFSDYGNGKGMALWKYDSSGNIVGSFGNKNGMAKYPLDYNESCISAGQSLQLDSSGNIYVSGSRRINGSDAMYIWKYKPSGDLDDSFGNGGVIIFDSGISKQDECGNALLIDKQGDFYVAGHGYINSSTDLVLRKYNRNGVPDPSFGTAGLVHHHNAAGGESSDYGYGLALSKSGDIYVSGCSHNSSHNADMCVWKFESDGSLDKSFGRNGIYTYGNTNYSNSKDIGYDIEIDGNGGIYVAGRISMESSIGMTLWKIP